MLKSKLTLLAMLMVLMPFQLANASGSFPSGSVQPRPVDAVYERGKALFKGRDKSYADVRVCINDSNSGETVKVKKKLLKPFKKAKVTDFAASLHNCAMPEEKIADVYALNDLAALVHYFNKRYKLKLQYGS